MRMKPLRRTRNGSDQEDRSRRRFIREPGKDFLVAAPGGSKSFG
jgi:hypothetical protein